MTHIPDDAVQAALDECDEVDWVSALAGTGLCGRELVVSIIAAALPYIYAPCAVEVKKLEWEHFGRYGLEERAKTSIGYYSIHIDEDSAAGRMFCYFHLTEDGDCTKYGEEIYSGYGEYETIKSAAQADFERRVLSCVVTKPVDVAAVHENRRIICERLEGLASWLDGSQHSKWCGRKEVPIHGFSGEGVLVREAITLLRALSAEPAQGKQWHPIETAPKDGSTFLAVNIGEIERWHTTQEGVVITVKANDRPMTCACYNNDDGTPVFTDEFGEVYTLDGIVCDAEDMTAAENVLRLTCWMPLPAAPTTEVGRAALAQEAGK